MPSPIETAPPAAVDPSTLLTTSQIASRIAKQRGRCERTCVWRALKRLNILATLTIGNISLYTEADANAVEAQMRNPNRIPSTK